MHIKNLKEIAYGDHMCGILAGVIQGEPSRKDLEEARIHVERAFNTSNTRGPEHSQLRSYADGLCFLGMHRLAINGLSAAANQPLTVDNCNVVCNGEIYNHEQIISDSPIEQATASDCEAIVHAMRICEIPSALCILDGVFATAVYDQAAGKFIVARDTYGVRPLFSGKIQLSPTASLRLFGSEMKYLHECAPETVDQFFPGSCAVYVRKDLSFTYAGRQQFRAGNACPLPNTAPTLAISMAWVRNALEDAVWKRVQNTERPIACLLSGGLDSTIITALVAKCIKPAKVRTFSIGLDGSPDLEFARLAAKYIGTDHTEIRCTEDEFVDAIPHVIRAIESYDTTTVRASVGNYLVAKYISRNTDCKVVFNGDGADEVSGGYVYFRAAPSRIAFDAECQRLLGNIHFFDVLRSDRSMGAFGLEARTPFLDPAFVSAYLSVPTEERMPAPGGIEKALLRTVFKDILPPEVANRKKEAFSDGVSSYQNSWYLIINRNLHKLGTSTPGLHEARYNPPATREMAIYRTIFNEAYPSRAHVIPYFWMPRWVSATDASARTLDLY